MFKSTLTKGIYNQIWQSYWKQKYTYRKRKSMSDFKSKYLRVLLFIPLFVSIALACSLFSPDSPDATMDTLESQQVIVEPTQPAQEVVPLQDSPVVQQDVPISDLVQQENNLIDLYSRVNPSVVNITTYQQVQNDMIPNSQGSGFVYDMEGHIVTNAHVVHGSDQIDVSFADGTVTSADIVGEDLHSDLAVLEVSNMPEGTQPVQLGSMSDVLVGQTVIAIGNPFGYNGTLTRGIVSGIGRTIPALTSFSIPQAIQTDASINPGNSGGPLLNLNGQVIGVNAQIQTDGFSQSNQGVGFAIPVSIVKRVVPALIDNGEINWAWLGVAGGDLTRDIAEAMNISSQSGAYLSSIIENGPADEAGLQGNRGEDTNRGRRIPIGGDVIVAINGQQIQSFDDLLNYIALNSSPGDEVNLTIFRDGETIDVRLVLGARPDSLQNFIEP
jgi:S1-C subfamily serine protease